jgi:hypothetical protein
MAQLMKVRKLTRLTFVRRGRAMAKHPSLRSGAVEVVKSTPVTTGPVVERVLWLPPRQQAQSVEKSAPAPLHRWSMGQWG